MRQKYKIVLDTNILRNEDDNKLNVIFNNKLEHIFNFIQDNDLKTVDLCIPKLVIDERVAQRVKQIRDKIDTINTEAKAVGVFSNRKVAKKKFNPRTYKKKLNKIANELIKKYKIKEIKTTKVDQDIILDRALNKVPPFYSKGGDKGFKDSLIWLSILEDVKNNKKFNYILVTNDSGFNDFSCKEEFKAFSSGHFTLVNKVEDLMVFLQKAFSIDPKEIELIKKVKQEILSKPGSIMQGVIRHLKNMQSLHFDTLSKYDRRGFGSYEENENKLSNLDYQSLNINDIYKVNENSFKVYATLNVVSAEKEEAINLFEEISPMVSFSKTRNLIHYDVAMLYNKDSKDFNIMAVSPSVNMSMFTD